MANMSGSQILISPQRAVYERALSITNGNPDFIIQEKTLRLEAALIPGRNQYTFDLFQNIASDRPGELKLNRNDLFLMSSMALNITKQRSATDLNTGNDDLYTWNDSNFFIGVPSSGEREYRCLSLIYNGVTTIKTSPVERIKEFHNQLFRYVPNRPYIKFSTPQVGDQSAEYGPFNEHRGFYQITPNIIIDGNENNSVELTLGRGDSAVIDGSVNASGAAATTRNVVVYLINGFSIIGGAKAQLKWF